MEALQYILVSEDMTSFLQKKAIAFLEHKKNPQMYFSLFITKFEHKYPCKAVAWSVALSGDTSTDPQFPRRNRDFLMCTTWEERG